MNYGRVILGDNQFLGVNHYSQAAATLNYRDFSDTERILEVLGWAYDCGVRDFMFTTHDRFCPVLDEIIRSQLFPGMQYTPCLPYAHKYANAMAEKGMVEVVWDTLRQTPNSSIFRSGLRALAGDFGGVMRLLVGIELLMCKGLPVRGVFIQNVLFDLLIGLDACRLIETYSRFVAEELRAIPGFITMNHAAAVYLVTEKLGLRDVWLCANLNKNGFRTNPSRDDVASSFGSRKTRNIAMSVFGPGAAGAAESLEYVLAAPGVDAILFGSSRRENIASNALKILGTSPDVAGAPVMAPGQ